jgi:hypothetical protein
VLVCVLAALGCTKHGSSSGHGGNAPDAGESPGLGIIHVADDGSFSSGSGGAGEGSGGSGMSGSGGAGGGGTGGGVAIDAGGTTALDSGMDASTGTTAALDAGAVIVGDVLTNQPNLRFHDNGSQHLAITSAFIVLEIISDTANSLNLHGELENRGSDALCIPLVDSLSLGGWAISAAVVDGPAHTGSSGASMVCLVPGARGAWRAISNDVPPTLLDKPTDLAYAITGLSGVDQGPSAAEPVLLATNVTLKQNVYEVTGKLRAGTTIYNLEVAFYARGANGLLMDDDSAWPSNLGTIPAGTILDYASGGFFNLTSFTSSTVSITEPAGIVHYSSFIVGEAPSSSSTTLLLPPQAAPPEQERMQRDSAQRRAYATQRQALDAR